MKSNVRFAVAALSVLGCVTIPSVSDAGPTQKPSAGGASFLGNVKPCQHDDPRNACKAAPPEGSLGAGPTFSVRSRSTRFQGALIEGSNLFIGFGEKSNLRSEVTAVYSVDLATGNRKIVAGGYVSNPTDEYKAQKVVTTGAGPALGIISMIRRLRPGKLLVSAYNGLFIVDDASGNREKVTVDESSGCAKNVGGMDLTTDGKLVMVFEDRTSSGVEVFDLQTKRCKVVSNHTDNPKVSPAVGSGVEFPSSRFSSIVRAADDPNVFFALHWAQTGIWSVNITTGARQIVAKRSGPLKRGDTDDFLSGMPSTTPGRIWYASDEAQGVPVRSGRSGVQVFNATSGESTAHVADQGPAADMTTVMLPMPSDPRWVVFTNPLRAGVALLDTQSKASLWVSF